MRTASLTMLTHFSAQSRPWTLFRQKKGSDKRAEKRFRQDDRENLTVPKPDWVAFFPIYTRKFLRERIPTSKKWQLTKDPKNVMIENFSDATLQHLARRGVQSNTAGLFRNPQSLKRMVLSDCICFPWLIVEHKKAGDVVNEEECHCQAANAGTAAVMMLETLSKIVPGGKKHMADEHIPPVITMTTVDKIVRVWITYRRRRSGDDAVQYVSRSMLLFSGGICLLTYAYTEDGLHLEGGHDACPGSHQIPCHPREHAHLGHARATPAHLDLHRPMEIQASDGPSSWV
jgi:hypothetical protein